MWPRIGASGVPNLAYCYFFIDTGQESVETAIPEGRNSPWHRFWC